MVDNLGDLRIGGPFFFFGFFFGFFFEVGGLEAGGSEVKGLEVGGSELNVGLEVSRSMNLGDRRRSWAPQGLESSLSSLLSSRSSRME
jgi:hypothetical protein